MHLLCSCYPCIIYIFWSQPYRKFHLFFSCKLYVENKILIINVSIDSQIHLGPINNLLLKQKTSLINRTHIFLNSLVLENVRFVGYIKKIKTEVLRCRQHLRLLKHCEWCNLIPHVGLVLRSLWRVIQPHCLVSCVLVTTQDQDVALEENFWTSCFSQMLPCLNEMVFSAVLANEKEN